MFVLAARTIRLPVPWWAAILITIGIFVVTTVIRSWWANRRARARGEVVSNDGYGVPEQRALEAMKSDPAFAELLNRARANHMIVDGTPPDPNSYELCWGAFWSPQGMQLPSSTGAGSAAAYLKRKADPKRLAVSLDLTNGTYHEMVLGGMQWSAIVPGFMAPRESMPA